MTYQEQKQKNLRAFEKSLAASPTIKVGLTHTFDLPANTSPVVGEWYYGVTCRKCNRTIAVLPDETNGQRVNAFEGPGMLRIECPYCANTIQAGPNAISSFQMT